MSILAKIFDRLYGSENSHIFYKIVERRGESSFIVQCINTNATFTSSISSIVLDTDIVFGLHPIQSCYLGMEYSKNNKLSNQEKPDSQNHPKKINHSLKNRYGRYSIIYQTRSRAICFVDKETKQEMVMQPLDIALSEEIIQEFDSIQSFHIGVLAGLDLNSGSARNNPKKNFKAPKLRVVR